MIFMRTYAELSQLETFMERFRYLQLNGTIGDDTFGFDRYLNQVFYTSKEWRHVRDIVIVRDNGNDLGVTGFSITKKNLIVHHMNPICVEDILKRKEDILNPEYLISVSRSTHQAIHYGNLDLLPKELVKRKPNDTCPWKK